MTLSQKELDAGADAVIKLATEAGYGSFVSMDSARSIAAAVIKAYQAEQAAEQPK